MEKNKIYDKNVMIEKEPKKEKKKLAKARGFLTGQMRLGTKQNMVLFHEIIGLPKSLREDET